MQRLDTLRVTDPQGCRHECTPVAALGKETLIAEPGHQLGPGIGNMLDPPARPGRFVGETETRQRRRHHVKCGLTGRRIGQLVENIQELHHRSGPPMSHQQGPRIRTGGTDVKEMNPQPVDHRAPLAAIIELGFEAAPVVLFEPVTAQLLDVGTRNPL